MKKYLSENSNADLLIDVLDEMPLWSAPFGLKLLNFVDYKSNITALDIGFGTGFPLVELAMRLGSGSTVYGIDPWDKALERTRQKIDGYGIDNVNLIKGVAENIPLPDNSIDLIVSNNGINNVSDISQTLKECSRVMKDGGQFVLTMNLDKTMFEFYQLLEQVMIEMDLRHCIDSMHQHIKQKRRPLDEVVGLLKQNGFRVEELEFDQFNYKFANGTAMLNHFFIRLAFMDPWIKILQKNRVEEVFNNVEKELNCESDRAGLIKLSIPFVVIKAKKQR
jgi:arsenite methyltransferase